MEKEYMNFRKIDEQTTEMYVYGDIASKDIFDLWFGGGDEKTNAYSLKEALEMIDTPNLTVRINSYGGEVAEGLAVYSLLSDFKGHVKTIVDGYACSAASIIFMAGEERIVPENGLLMIHNAWSRAVGDSNAMKKMAEDLEKITQPSVNIYVNKTGLDEEQVKEMMDRETWITSQEAYELGFSTTQTRNSAKQALEADFIHNLVLKNKALNEKLEDALNQIENYEKSKVAENLVDSKEILEKSNNIIEDAWTSFFNVKK